MTIEVFQGSSALVLGMPHTGTDVPEDIWAHLNDNGRLLADTDWHIHTLYKEIAPNASMVRTHIHRYAIDCNRNPEGVSLYPGQNTTSLIPTTDFDGLAIWNAGEEPNEQEIVRRKNLYHQPYHEALEKEINRVKSLHGFAILFDCHSIRSHIPYLFDGQLPDFNIGTNDGASCDPRLQNIVVDICEQAKSYTSVLNARFKGGWTTRHYGQPSNGVHAIQMELAQSSYLRAESPPWAYDPQRANQLQIHLKKILESLEHWRPE